MARSNSPTKKATRQHTKQHNARLVFKTIYETGEISRADLARLALAAAAGRVTAVQYATTESNFVLLGASALILSQRLGVI